MNEKELREKRDQIVEQMQAITDNATNVEKRTLTTEEQQKFAGLKKEVEDIDATLEAMEQSRTLLPPVKTPEKKEPVEDIEIRTFANIIRNRVDANITKTANGAVIPTTIAKKIIDVAKDRSPLFKDAEKYRSIRSMRRLYVDTPASSVISLHRVLRSTISAAPYRFRMLTQTTTILQWRMRPNSRSWKRRIRSFLLWI